MRYSSFRAGARGDRWLLFLAVLVLVVFFASSFLLVNNYKHFGNLVKVISLVRNHYLKPVATSTMVDGAIKGIVDSLGDPYSVYLEPKTFNQLQEVIKGSFGGIGVLVGLKDQYIGVVRVFRGTPAAKAGIIIGDVITSIDDRDVRGIDLETAVQLMRGPVGSKVMLGIKREGASELLKIPLTREEISVPTVESRVISGTSIGYVVVSQFAEKTAGEMRETLEILQAAGIKGLILDLRDNPGGELKAAVEVSKFFIPKGPIVYIDFRVGRDETFYSDGNALRLPLVVLINDNSASAAEILAGAVKDTRMGTLVGTKTFGKGVVQTVFPLDNGAALKLTTARYLTPSKNDINEKGILPDVVVQQPSDRAEDVQMQKALEIMKGEVKG
jgi:carboxyl-terminal processing protease